MKSSMDKMCGHIVVQDAGECSPMDKRSHVMTMTKYGAIHPSKYRFTPLQWSGVLTKHLALCYIVFTFSPDVLSYIGIASRPSMQLPPALCSITWSRAIFRAKISPAPPKHSKNEAKRKSPKSFESTNNSELLHAADGGRTRTLSPERDFKSLVSANFTTAAQPRLTKPCCPLA